MKSTSYLESLPLVCRKFSWSLLLAFSKYYFVASHTALDREARAIADIIHALYRL